ncbi:SPOR domain-containing protein [Lutimonas halocynthiae]|uniref:SPOR domain-containing protein n=1 Tax=Lutimonas halocynthiae TaxID=1446477 RepID=UPI0025B4CED0|nr:SPOR domain-containing protein [Lutimonas halocynthiae]MDN3643004.1 SPOR domain-containing protein [Lutimonas halocynthiae]
MKKLMTMMLAVIPFGMFAQSAPDVYASNDDIFNMSYADAGNAFTTEKSENKDTPLSAETEVYVSDNDMLEVNDLLLANPDFDIQENMVSFTKDQKTVFFSANKKIKEKSGNETDQKIKNSVQLQLFKASVAENGEWVNLEMLPFNGKRHSTGHPALNKDDTQLFFVSDGPESTGKTDIFVVDLLEDGTYGKPENLGTKINSEEREVFPFVDDSSVLYFESDIKTEGGDLNVFASEVIDNELTTPIKLDIEANGAKEAYITAFKAVDAEAMRIAEDEANLRDMEILLDAENLAEIDRIEEVLGENATGAAYDFSTDNIVYTVQIGAFMENVKTGTYEDSSGLFNHRYDDGYNRFYSGVFESNKEAMNHMEQMKKDGYKDAFVLGLEGKKRFLP